jgi:hypothetical protein
MPKKKKILLICLASLLAILLFTVTILPLIIRSKAIASIEEETGRKVRIEKVSINPFTLAVTVKGFTMDAKEGGLFERVFQKNDDIFKAPAKDTQTKSRVELNAIAQ